jgi:hypothetical protein
MALYVHWCPECDIGPNKRCWCEHHHKEAVAELREVCGRTAITVADDSLGDAEQRMVGRMDAKDLPKARMPVSLRRDASRSAMQVH